MDSAEKKFPFQIKDVDTKLAAEINQQFLGDNISENLGYVQVGPKNYFLQNMYKDAASDIYNMEIRPNDIIVASFPRSGTTWTQELVWLVANDLDYEKAKCFDLLKRYKLIGGFESQEYSKTLKFSLVRKNLDSEDKTPWFFKTHVPMSLLPPLDLTKTIYVARDPRDVAVSYYKHFRWYWQNGVQCDFKTYWNYFINNFDVYTPYFEHIKEAWSRRHNPNLLVIFYEESSKDLHAVIRRVSSFLGKSYNEEQIHRLSQHLNIKNFRHNESVNRTTAKGLFKTSRFIGEGKVGGWRDYFDEEMTEQAEKWIADNLKDTDLKYPHLEASQDKKL